MQYRKRINILVHIRREMLDRLADRASYCFVGFSASLPMHTTLPVFAAWLLIPPTIIPYTYTVGWILASSAAYSMGTMKTSSEEELSFHSYFPLSSPPPSPAPESPYQFSGIFFFNEERAEKSLSCAFKGLLDEGRPGKK